ncbi:hypothetical protein C8J48_3257 [Desmospora activa DSM 45169]|uniref:Uncharacterized protein n=1 Tax=Desmospora activa DSM 45169 TaxID=1121389 RepID=A0A2T4Z4W5_9BACL|nr:hypothetical protein C8J48_3257 [Desmospora activa DSM 45169]
MSTMGRNWIKQNQNKQVMQKTIPNRDGFFCVNLIKRILLFLVHAGGSEDEEDPMPLAKGFRGPARRLGSLRH